MTIVVDDKIKVVCLTSVKILDANNLRGDVKNTQLDNLGDNKMNNYRVVLRTLQ